MAGLSFPPDSHRLRCASSPGAPLPRVFSRTGLSATLPTRPSPHGAPVCRVHGTDRASRVAAHSIFHTCRRPYPGGNRRCSRCSLPTGRRPSPNHGRVGFRDDCLGYRLSCEALLPKCFSLRRYLGKTPWPLDMDTTSRSNSYWVGFAPTRNTRLATAHHVRRSTRCGLEGWVLRRGSRGSEVRRRRSRTRSW